jgi:hypothetical protein
MPHSEDFNRAIRGARAGREITGLMTMGYLCLLKVKAGLGAADDLRGRQPKRAVSVFCAIG